MALKSAQSAAALARSLRRITCASAAQAACSSSNAAFSSASSAPPEASATESVEPARKAAVNKLLYRARQRGWLELDLLVGMWAERELPTLRPDVLPDVEALLGQENPDLYKWLTGQLPAPEELTRNRAFNMIREDVQRSMSAHGCAVAAAPQGAEWVRGWDDRDKLQAEHEALKSDDRHV